MITVASYLKRVAPFYRPRPQENLASSSSSMSGLGKETVSSEDVLEVDIAGGREVPLIGICELHVLGLITCVGCDIVQADHAPEAGVCTGDLSWNSRQAPWQDSGRGGRRTWRRSRETGWREHSRTSAHADDHGWKWRHTDETWATCGRCMHECNASKDGAQRAQNYAVFTSVCIVVFMQLFTMRSRLLKLCVKNVRIVP